MNRYSLPEPLLQLVINTLSQRPFAEVADLLGAIRGECQQQDQQRAEARDEQVRAETRAAIAAERAAAAPATAAESAAPAADVPVAAPLVYTDAIGKA